MDRESLNLMTRDELIAYARRTGVYHPDGMTRAELRDEIVRRTETDVERRRVARGWFGVARDLVASLVEQGLHLPDAAKLIRGDPAFRTRAQAPIATVALAEIYAAQGHTERALRLLDQVLAKEPDHQPARRLHERLSQPVAPPPSSLADATGGTILEETTPPPAPADAESAVEAAAVVPDTTPPPAPADAESAVEAAAVVPDTTPPPAPADAESAVEAATVVPDTTPPPAPADAESAVEAATVVPDTTPPPAPADAESAVEAAAVVPDTTPPPAPAEGSAEEAEPDCDALFSIAGRERSHYVYWELSRATLERVRRFSPTGHPALKIVFYTPSPRGAQRFERMVSVCSSTGSVTLESPTPKAVARAALGWQLPSEFLPLVVATPLGASGPRSAFLPSPRAVEVSRVVQARALAAYRSVPAR